jgi:hypothetical protein
MTTAVGLSIGVPRQPKDMADFNHNYMTIFDTHEVNFHSNDMLGRLIVIKVPVQPIPDVYPYFVSRTAIQEALEQ